YHIYKGGSAFEGLKLLNGTCLQHLHVNDYPADPPRETLRDADRVYPGDGVAPLGDILRTLRDIGFHGTLSLELFNPEYWQQDALTVAKTGLEKTRNAVEQALKS
ncbi:MAG: sugar phosphate isomerase/epimerase family protein, partial [Planctomycetaceae bacterium]